MMGERIHLVGEEDDDEDLYSGYDNGNYIQKGLEDDAEFQQAVKTSYGHRAASMTASKGGANGQARLGTGVAINQDQARPMTAIRGAGFNSTGGKLPGESVTQANRGPAPPLESKYDDNPEEKIRQMEKKVNELIEESALAGERGELQLALEKAKEAGRRERMICKQREQAGLSDQINLDLTYSVLFVLANQYQACDMYQEALNSFSVIVKNKMFSNAGRLRVNMGNIYSKQGKHQQAIRMYRMALDQVPNANTTMRIKIMQNIGSSFVRLGQYEDAVTVYDQIMTEKGDFKTGLNLIVCYYSINDRDKMKKTFQRMLMIDLGVGDDEKFMSVSDDNDMNIYYEAIRNDTLWKVERERKSTAERCIMYAAKLIAPVIEPTFAAGFDWCIGCVKSSPYVELANDLEITKAVTYLKMKDLAKATETLKSFEKKDSTMATAAATNLAFLYIQEGELSLAEKYSDLAITSDRYNPNAMVNKGNCLFTAKEYEKAQEYYKEALNVEASCVEALYNLGLTKKMLNCPEESLDCFLKLHGIIRNDPMILVQIAELYEVLDDFHQAIDWYTQVLTLAPTDASLLAKLGALYDSQGDKSQAFQYYLESYRYYPSNIETISWIGSYYIESQFCEKAISYFDKASMIQPNEVKWQLMVASCYRIIGNYNRALDKYKQIHEKFPENTDCLKFLVRVCTDLGMKEAQEYAGKLKKAEKAKEIKQQRTNSANRNGVSSRQSGSAGSERAGSGRNTSRNSSAKIRDEPDPIHQEESKEIDTTYNDPLGDAPARPKTAARRRNEDEFGDEELGDDLLPE
ncbi:Intraflagellar transport protein 88-like protein [Trichoplax sp. H2]|nr:Intraflagellar transport protein 88-like protein [Trichoplax sp. H2]|eukprot:RDD37238.1 Intraflagellar transport protein 88-like protein [Trichoplax sp. H2]